MIGYILKKINAFSESSSYISCSFGAGDGSVAQAETAGTNPGLGGIDLSTMGVQAPTVSIGTTAVEAGTLQYSNSGDLATHSAWVPALRLVLVPQLHT